MSSSKQARFGGRDSFMTEVRILDSDDQYGGPQSPSARYDPQNNPYDRRFEDEDTSLLRKFVVIWYDLTQEVRFVEGVGGEGGL